MFVSVAVFTAFSSNLMKLYKMLPLTQMKMIYREMVIRRRILMGKTGRWRM
jgi:hypothetical protein